MKAVNGGTIAALKQSPLFNLSLSSKELFHSNFLSWLCESYQEEAGRLFAAFLPKPTTAAIEKVWREQQNFDLRIQYTDGQHLVIENKVKRLPAPAQLDEYARKAGNTGKTGFLLLSLTDPLFFDHVQQSYTVDGQHIWHLLRYRDLAARLEQLQGTIAASNSYHGALLRDYIGFISGLEELVETYQVRWNDMAASFFLHNDQRLPLATARLHDLVDKLRYAQLAQAVAETLQTRGFTVSSRNPREMNPEEIHINSGMTRGMGLFDLKYILLNNQAQRTPIMPGLQLQGQDLRLVSEVWGQTKTVAQAVAERLRQPTERGKLWFDFSRVPGASAEYPRKGAFNQFSGVFFYRSRRLGDLSPQVLVDLIVAYAEQLHANREELRQHLAAVLKTTEMIHGSRMHMR